MQSYKTQIGDGKEDFLEHVRDYGQWETMDEFGFRDVVRIRKLLKEWTGDENFGINPRIGGDDKQLLETLFKAVRNHKAQDRKRDIEVDAEFRRLKAENTALRQMVAGKFGRIIKGLIEELDDIA